jgi:hypothetical protein
MKATTRAKTTTKYARMRKTQRFLSQFNGHFLSLILIAPHPPFPLSPLSLSFSFLFITSIIGSGIAP